MGVIRDMLRLSPLPEGALAPPLSLTADDGTWIKLRDFEGNLNVLLVFFADEGEATEQFVKALEAARARFEALETVIFAVNTNRTDRLRELRAHFRVQFHFVYDPLALTARAFGASRRALPMCRDAVFLIGKDQKVRLSERGFPEVITLLRAVAAAQGVELEEDRAGAGPAAAAQPGASRVRDPGKPAQLVQEITSAEAEKLLDQASSPYLLVDVRTKSEVEADRSPDAIHIQVDELPHRYHELKQTQQLIFVCQAGDRSAAAAEFMTSIGGHDIYTVNGGMSAWSGRRASGPIEPKNRT